MKTTYIQRFTDAITLLCGAVPPEDYVELWLTNEEDKSGTQPLHSWAIDNATLAWAQGIVVLDAAAVLANTPVEGEDHEDNPYEISSAFLPTFDDPFDFTDDSDLTYVSLPAVPDPEALEVLQIAGLSPERAVDAYQELLEIYS